MTQAPDLQQMVERVSTVPRCADFDDDCDEVPDKVHCYLYDPAKGYCPFLRTLKEQSR